MDAQKEKVAIERLKSFEPDDGYYLCYSGGKDSDVIRILADIAGVQHENVHNLTTVDAPETVQYIKSLPDVRIDYPETTMWKLIEKMTLPPTRKMRYCCEVLKEHGGAGKVKITGVRWDESAKRAESADVVTIIGKSKTTQKDADKIGAEYRVSKQGGVLLSTDNDEARRTVELCYRTRSTTVNPIVDWTDHDVWDFLHHYGCASNPLYQCGMHRIGCVGCPMADKSRIDEFRRYPKYYQNYIRAFDRMLIARQEKGLKQIWETGKDVMLWWLELPPKEQIRFEGFEL